MVSMAETPPDAALRELLAHQEAARVSVEQALKLAPGERGQVVMVAPAREGNVRAVDVLSVSAEESPGQVELNVARTRLDARDGRLLDGDAEDLRPEEQHAAIVAYASRGLKRIGFEEALRAAVKAAGGGTAAAVRFGGTQEKPTYLVCVAGKDDALTVELDAQTGEVLGRAAWRESLRSVAELLKQVERAGEEFDTSGLDVYADDAVIRNQRQMPSGEVRDMELSGAAYKTMIRTMLPIAKARGDRSSMRDVRFRMEGLAVRASATRYSHLKKYESPIDWLLARNAAGEWRIVEENSVSIP